MDELSEYTPGDKAARKAVFKKMTSEATLYRSPKEELQGKTILNLCSEVKNSEFSVTVKAMVKLLKLYRDYVAPEHSKETQQTAALKVCNKLTSCISEETLAVVARRATQLNLTLITQRELPPEKEVIDLSDEEDVPLSTDTNFTTHRSVLLDDKDGMLDAIPIERRIKDLQDERKTVREWGDKAKDNVEVARRVVQQYANQDRSGVTPEKAQQLLLKCLSHRIRMLESSPKPAQQTARSPISSNPWKGTTSANEQQPASQQKQQMQHQQLQQQMFHSSGTPMPKPPPSGLGESHEYNDKVVNTVDVQLVAPRVPHPVTASHARECLQTVSDIEAMQQHTDYRIDSTITDKIVRWFCPPGFSWALTFNTNDKRRQAFKMVKEATEVMNMRIRREATARVMAQRKMDASAKGTFPFFRYDIEREYQSLATMN